MINCNTYLTQSLISDDLILKDKNVIVIDVLRATSTMLVALANGAKEIVPVENAVIAARAAKGRAGSLLCGERNGKIIEGFNLGNSPFEYSPENIKDKILVFSTTNGTVAVMKTKHSKNTVLASFLNIDVVVDFISELNEDFVIVCSGKSNNFCLEDTVAAGMILILLFHLHGKSNYNIDDSGYAAVKLTRHLLAKAGENHSERIHDILKKTEQGKFLSSLGFQEDLKLCSEIDSYPYLPVFKNGIIKLKNSFDSEASQKSKMKRVNIQKPKSADE